MKNKKNFRNNDQRRDNQEPNSYSSRYKLDSGEISQDVQAKNEITGVIILALCEAGYEQGKRQQFSKNPQDLEDFESNPAWKSGPGFVIGQIQSDCLDKEGPLDFYREAYYRGLVDSGFVQDEA